MPKQYKIDKVIALQEYFDKSDDFIIADYRGLTVEKITELRKKLSAVSSKFIVMKNSYINVIAQNKKLPEMNEITKGPSAVAFSEGEINEVAKVLFDFTKENDKLKIKGGLVGSKVVAASEVEMLAKLPSKNQLIAMLMSTMNAPAQNL